ncbi:unnamed protein product [Blepharisma stoltei]|uniref:Uncharacterized protein n=1 Tax=Blepharisma stoltei TaxID=1481888 RepID=A0AAU9K3T9_9CILI|nr:unnamed protein product [Blepharisma stoltei]
MESRTANILIALSPLVFIYEYGLKIHLCSAQWIIYGTLAGLYVFWALGLFIRNRSFNRSILLYQPELNDGFLSLCSIRSLKYYILAGLTIGAFSGYNISIAYFSYQSLNLEFSISFVIDSLGSILGAIALLCAENSTFLQSYMHIIYPETKQWDLLPFLKSLYLCITIGEYFGLVCSMYAAALEIGIYVCYYLFLEYGWTFVIIAFLACCTGNIWLILQRVFMKRKYRFHKLKETEMDDVITV